MLLKSFPSRVILSREEEDDDGEDWYGNEKNTSFVFSETNSLETGIKHKNDRLAFWFDSNKTLNYTGIRFLVRELCAGRVFKNE